MTQTQQQASIYSADDFRLMAHALRLAERGLYGTTPNPRVGCVLAKDGEIVGEGWHQRAGEAHAEVHALQAAGTRAAGATAYVSLEPCSRFGRTAPCADALIQARVARVVAAMEDPNPRVHGSGLARLKAAGIDAQCGLLEDEARELNRGFMMRMTRGRPLVRIKIAASLDGKTALGNGVSQWITGLAARSDGHHWRARSCAVMTGIGTLSDDDPQLTVRHVETWRQPARIVVDSQLRISLKAKILQGSGAIIATASTDETKKKALRDLGADMICLPNGEGKVDLQALMQELGRREMNEILVEAGINLHSALHAAGVVDEWLLYLAPHFLGTQGRGILDLGALTAMESRQALKVIDTRRFGDDLRIIARNG
jgi:diaminohydroxyphosphoribosylaminopyrimidine deaminase/5-amino-6-(5-phosphoribosylamino)uracil reductase